MSKITRFSKLKKNSKFCLVPKSKSSVLKPIIRKHLSKENKCIKALKKNKNKMTVINWELEFNVFNMPPGISIGRGMHSVKRIFLKFISLSIKHYVEF